jgi:hypothetical protein
MAKELAIADRRPPMTSSPALRRLRRISLGTIQWPGQPEVRYLAGASRLRDDERAEAEALLTQLEQSLDPGGDEGKRARLGLVAKMLLAYPIAGASSESGRARGEAYGEALDDVPPWAVAAAVRAWHRGELGEGYDYRWAPAPAVLRKIALAALDRSKADAAHICAVLEAKTVDEAMKEPTAEEREQVLAGFQTLSARLRGVAQQQKRPAPEPVRTPTDDDLRAQYAPTSEAAE